MESFYREFGQRVRAARLALGMSQQTLAGKLGLGRTSITNLELGNQHVPLHMLVKLAHILQVAPTTLLPEGIGETAVEPQLLNGLQPEDQEWILGIVREMHGSSIGHGNEDNTEAP